MLWHYLKQRIRDLLSAIVKHNHIGEAFRVCGIESFASCGTSLPRTASWRMKRRRWAIASGAFKPRLDSLAEQRAIGQHHSRAPAGLQ
jgi:hypothetical protein